jgi:hypothetical protein
MNEANTLADVLGPVAITKARFTLRKCDCILLNEVAQPEKKLAAGDVIDCETEPYGDSGHVTVTITLPNTPPYSINGVRKGKPNQLGRWHEVPK